jgi:hypothetical protein
MKEFNEMLKIALSTLKVKYKERSFSFLMSQQKAGNNRIYMFHNKLHEKYGCSIDKEYLN